MSFPSSAINFIASNCNVSPYKRRHYLDQKRVEIEFRANFIFGLILIPFPQFL